MAYANLNRVESEIGGFDSIIIVKDNGDIPCGVTLDVTDVTANVILGGHLLVQNTTTFEVKPLGISGGSYVALPDGCAYYGILKETVLKAMPMASVLRVGTVNAAAAKNALGAEYPSAAKTALKNIDFIY